MRNEKVICALAATHYLVDRTIDAINKVMEEMRFPFYTGNAFNIIKQSALTLGYEHLVVKKTTPPKLNEENERPLELVECAWFSVQLANTLHRVTFIKVAWLAVGIIIGAAFLNRHVEEILCKEQ